MNSADQRPPWKLPEGTPDGDALKVIATAYALRSIREVPSEVSEAVCDACKRARQEEREAAALAVRLACSWCKGSGQCIEVPGDVVGECPACGDPMKAIRALGQAEGRA